MEKVTCYLNEQTVSSIEHLVKEQGKPKSRIMSDLIEKGLNAQNQTNGIDPHWDHVYKKMPYAQIQTLEIVKDILFCVFDSKAIGRDNARDRIEAIEQKTREYIEKLL